MAIQQGQQPNATPVPAPSDDQEIDLDTWDDLVADRYKVPKSLFRAMTAQESGGDVNAVSATGVKGRQQVTQAVARQYNLDRNDPFQQSVAAARYLRDQYDALKDIPDDDERWLASIGRYYAGPSAVKDGEVSGASVDGVSNPAQHVERVAKKWGAMRRAEGGQPSQPSPTESARPRATQPPKQDDIRRKAVERSIQQFEQLKSQGKREEANKLAAEIQKRAGDLVEVGGLSDWAYIKPRPETGFSYQLPPDVQAREDLKRKQAEYNAAPMLERRRQNIATGYKTGVQGLSDVLARGYDIASNALSGNFDPLLEQAEGAGRGLLKLASAFDPAGNAYAKVAPEQDAALANLEKRRAERLKDDPYTIGANVEKARLAREAEEQPGFGGAVTRGVTSGAIQTGPYFAASVAGGGLPALAGVAAAQSDFVKPEEAALNIAGATLPVKAGRALNPAINRAAGVLPGRAAQAAGRAAGQVGVGGGTNVAQSAVAGERDPQKLAEAAVTGGLLSGVDAAQAAGAGRPAIRSSAPEGVAEMGMRPRPGGLSEAQRSRAGDADLRLTTPRRRLGYQPKTAALDVQPQAGSEGQIIADYIAKVEEINASPLAPEQKQVALSQARTEYRNQRQAAMTRPATPEVDPDVIDADFLPADAPTAQPAAALPDGVQIFRQGEPLPPRQAGQRRLALDIPREDGSTETVMVLAPDKIDGKGVTPEILRPYAEEFLRPQQAPQQTPRPQPAVESSATAEPINPQSAQRPSRPAPRPQFFPQQRTESGAIMAPPSSIAGRKLLPPASGPEQIPPQPTRGPQPIEERIAQPDPRFAPRPRAQETAPPPAQPPARLESQPTPAPTRQKAGEDVQVFRPGEQPEFDPNTQKAVTFRVGKEDRVAIVPKSMSRMDAAIFGRSKLTGEQPTAQTAQQSASAAQESQRPQAPVDTDKISNAPAADAPPTPLTRRPAGRGRLIDDPKRPPSNPASTRVADPLLYEPLDRSGFFEAETPAARAAVAVAGRGRAEQPTSTTAPEPSRRVAHPDPKIDGKEVIAERGDGKVIVANPENKTGISVVKDRSATPNEGVLIRDQIPAKTEGAQFKQGDKVILRSGKMQLKGRVEGYDRKGQVMFRDESGEVFNVRPEELRPQEAPKPIEQKKPSIEDAETVEAKAPATAVRTKVDTEAETVVQKKREPLQGAKRRMEEMMQFDRETVNEGRRIIRDRDFQPRRLTKGMTSRDVLRDARIRNSKSQLRSNVIYANEQATYLLWQAKSAISGDKTHVAGISIPPKRAIETANYLRDRYRAIVAGDPLAKRNLGELILQLERAGKAGQTVQFIKAVDKTFKQIRGTVYHELTHAAEIKYSTTEEWFNAQPEAKKLAPELKRRNYSPDQYTGEAVAHILGGQRDRFGLSLDEAVNFLDNYFKNITTRQPDALESFNVLSAAPEMRPTVRSATQKYGRRIPERAERLSFEREPRAAGPPGADRRSAPGVGKGRQGRAQTPPAAQGRPQPKAKPTTQEIESASLGKAVGNALRRTSNEMRALWTSLDFSAPLSQGAILSIAHPVKAAKSFGKMFASLKQSEADAIDAEIAFHPLRKMAEDSGLFLATSAKLKADKANVEEGFAGSKLQELPGFRHAERAYRSYLDTLRLSTWESYVKTLQADGRTIESDPKAYKQMAEFINIATGRGSVKKGGKLDKASDLAGDILFSPRNMIANFQVLDPVRYATLSPGARKVVLKDALTVFGAMVGTAAVLNAAGATTSLNPESDDFMTVRLGGGTRYDLTFGKKTQVQFLARATMGLYRQATGEGNLPGKDALSVSERFARNKLAPLPGTVMTFLRGTDGKGEKIADKSYGRIAWETAAPMLWRDLVEAYQTEGGKGLALASPAIIGARVSTYPDRAKSQFLDVPAELRAEQKKAGEPRTFLTPRGEGEKRETPGQFAARKARANEWTRDYGLKLVSSQSYKRATPEEQKAARAYLKSTISSQSGEKHPSLHLLHAASILEKVRESARRKRLQSPESALQ